MGTFGDKFVVLDAPMACRTRKLLFTDFVREHDLPWEAVCAENIVHTLVFNTFHVYPKIEFSVSRDSLLESFWNVFGDLGVTFGCL